MAGIHDVCGGTSSMHNLPMAEDPAAGGRCSTPQVFSRPTSNYRYLRRPFLLVGCCTLSFVAVVVLASVACLVFMFIRHDEKFYGLVFRQLARLISRVLHRTGPQEDVPL